MKLATLVICVAVLSPGITWAQIISSPAPAPVPVPGLSCQDAGWCLAILPNGDLLIGSPRPGEDQLKKQGNVLEGLSDKRPRSFAVECNHSDYCIAIDGEGNWYSGSSRPGHADFFKRR